MSASCEQSQGYSTLAMTHNTRITELPLPPFIIISCIQCSVAACLDTQRKKNKWSKTDLWFCCIDFDHLFLVSLSALLLLHSTELQPKANMGVKVNGFTLKKIKTH